MKEENVRTVLEAYLSEDLVEIIMNGIKAVEEGDSDDVDG